MRIRDLIVVTLLGLLSVFAACNPIVYSPPVRPWPEETTPRPLPKGRNAIAVAGGLAMANTDEWSGSDFTAGNGRIAYRRAMVDNLEAGVSLSYTRILPDDEDHPSFVWPPPGDDELHNSSVSPRMANLRLGAKYGPPGLERWLSARAGAGLGTSAAGQYVGLDMGVVLGYDNPFMVPFGTVGFYGSFPFNTKTVFFYETEQDPYASHYCYVDRMEITYGVDLAAGLKVSPFTMDAPDPDPYSLAIFFTVSTTLLAARYHELTFWPFQLGVGTEVEF